MTVYKSKGLEFDIVFLPDLTEKNRSFVKSQIHDGLNILSENDNNQLACTLLPKRDYSVADPNIKNYIKQLDSEHCYEKLCCLYVAMTRAKRALYMYIEQQGKNSKSIYTSTFLKNALSQANNIFTDYTPFFKLYENGDEGWIKDIKPIITDNKVKVELGVIKLTPNNIPEKETPSGSHAINNDYKTKNLYTQADTEDKTEIGICIHYMMEKIDYLDDRKKYIFKESDINKFDNSIWLKAHSIFAKATDSKIIIDLLSKPKDLNIVLWKEKSFSLILKNGKWLTGQFDRLEIQKDKNNNILQVNIFDYKCESFNLTDEQIKKSYLSQMQLYREAAEILLKIPKDIINTKLILLNRLKVLEI